MNATRRFLALAVLGTALLARPAFAAPAPARPGQDECLTCHEDEPQAKAFRSDIHFLRGVGCAGCHGGDPTSDDKDVAMSRASGFRGKVGNKDVVALCGQCHGAADTRWRRQFRLTNVVDSLAASVHGEALRGNERGPQCVSCHGVHGIVAVDDPASPVHPSRVAKTCGGCHGDARYMRDFNPRLPVDQYEKYLTSEHGRRNAAGDPRPATCVSCHSNHLVLKVKDPRSPVYATRIPSTCARCHSDAKYMASYRIPTDQFDAYRKSAHGVALLEKSDLNAPACNSCHGNHGAMPPGAASVVAVCGNCHQSNAELFDASVHRAAFEKQDLAGCVGCHGNHFIASPSDSLVSFASGSPCAKCHRDGPADRASGDIRHLRALLDSLSVGKAQAEAALHRAEQLGMDVSDARYELKDAHQALVQSRVAIHSFRVADLAAVARPGIGIIATARAAGDAAFHEYHFRRRGLAISTLVVTVLVVLLYLKLRQIERRQKT
jgi:hypothetical protein